MTMANCEFSVIKYVPSIVRFEPVNIGIALIDKEKKQLYNKFIHNFDELFSRLGVSNIHGLKKSFEEYNPVINVESDDFLQKIHSSFHGSMTYSEPTKITTDDIDNTLDRIFTQMISINKKEQIRNESTSVKKIKKNIQSYFSLLRLPKENYCKEYEISKLNIPQTRQFAFLKNNKLLHTIDIFDFLDNQIHSSLKLFMYDIVTIMESKHYPDNKPHIFSANSPELTDISDNTKQLVDLLNAKKIEIVYPDAHQEKLDEIKASII